jgi:hypothetical protein
MALFERLTERIETKAHAAADATLRGAEAAFAAIPDVRLRREGDTLVIEAMGLARRWISDVRLRFAFWRGR